MRRRRKQLLSFRKLREFAGFCLRAALKAAPFAIFVTIAWLLSSNIKSMLYANPYFSVGAITVYPSGVLTHLEIEYLEEVTDGKSLMEIDLAEISKALERNPRIKQGAVTRIFPDRIAVRIHLRDPVVQVQFSEKGLYYLVGPDRVIIDTSANPNPQLTIFEDFKTNDNEYSLGSYYRQKKFKQLIELLDLMYSDEIFQRETITRISLDQLHNWKLVLGDAVVIMLGKEVRLSEEKRQLLSSILVSDERKDLIYIDARYHDIVVRRK
jgi:cell division septal protein FtsQ